MEQPVATLSLVHENNNSPIGTPHSHIKAEPLDMGLDVSPPPPTLPPPMANSPLGEALKKYCSTCDISFNYVKTYLAHKQFYCKGKLQRPEASDSPSPNPVSGGVHAAMPLQSPSELLLLQKNKENLQEAAIWESQLMWEAQRKQLEWYYKCFWITDQKRQITEPKLKPYPSLEPEPELNPRESKKRSYNRHSIESILGESPCPSRHARLDLHNYRYYFRQNSRTYTYAYEKITKYSHQLVRSSPPR